MDQIQHQDCVVWACEQEEEVSGESAFQWHLRRARREQEVFTEKHSRLLGRQPLFENRDSGLLFVTC